MTPISVQVRSLLILLPKDMFTRYWYYQILHMVSVLNYRIMLETLFSICFHSFLRLGEVTVKQGIVPDKVIQFKDVEFQYNGSTLYRVQLVFQNPPKMNKPITICLESPSCLTIVLSKHCTSIYLIQVIHLVHFFQHRDGSPITHNYVSKQLQICGSQSGTV